MGEREGDLRHEGGLPEIGNLKQKEGKCVANGFLEKESIIVSIGQGVPLVW